MAQPTVLFVCVHNAGRSQMAAGLLAYHAAGRVAVRSAGSAPGERVNPSAVAVMQELGIDNLQIDRSCNQRDSTQQKHQQKTIKPANGRYVFFR